MMYSFKWKLQDGTWRNVCVLYTDEEDLLYQLCDTEDGSDEVLEQSGTEVSHKQTTQVTHTHFYKGFHSILVNDVELYSKPNPS